MITHCDMCGTKIENGKCICGTWKTPEEMKDNPIKLSLEHFHEMKRFSLTTDAPHLGCAAVFFRGNMKDCEKVQKYIYWINGRQYYEED